MPRSYEIAVMNIEISNSKGDITTFVVVLLLAEVILIYKLTSESNPILQNFFKIYFGV